jgi:hypothetical protein
LTQLTLESNRILDADGMCQVFLSLKSLDKLEGINFRQNNFSDKLVDALAEGIKMKKELRVNNLLTLLYRLSTWVRI